MDAYADARGSAIALSGLCPGELNNNKILLKERPFLELHLCWCLYVCVCVCVARLWQNNNGESAVNSAIIAQKLPIYGTKIHK